MEVTKIPEMSQNTELSPQQMQAITLLMAGKSLTAIAEELSCSRKTLYKWKSSNPHFIAAFNERKNEMYEAANNRLQTLVTKAIDVLENNLEDGNCAAAVNVLKIVDLKPLKLETDVEVLVKQQSEQIALTQLYEVLPFAVTPRNPVDTQTQKLANDICEILRTHYRISSDTLDELQAMSKLETQKQNLEAKHHDKQN